MSRWTLYRKQHQRRQHAFLLLTLSGAIRPAHVEIPYSRERRFAKGTSPIVDRVETIKPSIWTLDIRELFSKTA
jgi:hypothetical protein